MSKCISSHGEYSEHEPGDPCPYCGEYDMDRIVAERDNAEARIQAIEKMIAPVPAHPNKFAHTCGQDPDDVVYGYPDCPGCWVTALRHLLDGDA